MSYFDEQGCILLAVSFQASGCCEKRKEKREKR
jgi:hypothetical protein